MDQILLVNIGGNIVLNDVHLPPGWGEVCISCVLRTLVGGGGHCRTGCSEPDCDRCGGDSVSPSHVRIQKGEANLKLLLSEKRGRLSGKLGHTL